MSCQLTDLKWMNAWNDELMNWWIMWSQILEIKNEKV